MDIELGDAVAALRDQLVRAAAQGSDAGLQFAVGPIEMSFEVELRRDAKAKAGFKAWVVTGDVEAGVGHARKQRVTLSLTPKLPGGGDVLVGSDPGEDGPGDLSERIDP
ncbi:trypco2 family protein [Nocardia sp. NPDC058666]|uniref:trypco2 family protein n=1 Tax=Nocardia sp. NPDC058666 TaxID=3346587 RepID=UPI0036656600